MRNFVTPLPSSNNVKGSGVGSPAADMNKISDALVEIRTSVPSTTSDVSAITLAQLNDLLSRVTALQTRVNALKITSISDAFTRSSLGSGYTVTNSTAATVNGSALVNNTAENFIMTTNSVKTSFMWTKLVIIADANTTEHPCVVSNATSNASHYRAGYSAVSGKFELYRVSTSGTFWNMVAASNAMSKPSSSYSLAIRNTNGNISVQFNDATIITYSDNTPLTGKKAGIFFPQSGTSQRFIDDLQYGDV